MYMEMIVVTEILDITHLLPRPPITCPRSGDATLLQVGSRRESHTYVDV